MKTSFLLSLSSLLLLTSLSANASWRIGGPTVWVNQNTVVGDIQPMPSNNNVSIERFDNKLFMVWRSSPDHFASKDTMTYVVYSTDEGKTWTRDLAFNIQADVREGLLKTMGGKLHLFYFEGGTAQTTFDPKRVVHRVRLGDGQWSDPVQIAGDHEVVWDIQEHNGKFYKVAYHGPHYRFIPGILEVTFEETTDGETWTPVDGAKDSVVYRGGVCEVSFQFDDQGNLYGVGRNEDGDKTGFGAQIFTAKAGNLGEWTSLNRSLPHRYDSPRMFKHHGELYLLARRDTHPFDRGSRWLPFNVRRWIFLGLYSLQQIHSALYHFNRETMMPELVSDIPGAGDNAYPSVVQTDADNFLVANYSSPLEHTDWDWIKGQKSKEGTEIYSLNLTWVNDGQEGLEPGKN